MTGGGSTRETSLCSSVVNWSINSCQRGIVSGLEHSMLMKLSGLRDWPLRFMAWGVRRRHRSEVEGQRMTKVSWVQGLGIRKPSSRDRSARHCQDFYKSCKTWIPNPRKLLEHVLGADCHEALPSATYQQNGCGAF